jgi:DNA-binding PadR family transcriptional regulator
MERLGSVEAIVLAAVDRGAPTSRCAVTRVPALREELDGEHLLHSALRRCARDGLVRRERRGQRTWWVLTAKGRARLRARRRFGRALASLLARTHAEAAGTPVPTGR